MPREEVDEAVVEEKKARSVTDLQRIRLERLIKNIDKPAPIPQPRKEKEPAKPLEFVRNVVSSSAAAGSAEFHIYRNNRRKEMNRLAYIDAVAKRQDEDVAFNERRLHRQAEAEAKTAKKRAKRMKRKARQQEKKSKKETSSEEVNQTSSSSELSDAEENRCGKDEEGNVARGQPEISFEQGTTEVPQHGSSSIVETNEQTSAEREDV